MDENGWFLLPRKQYSMQRVVSSEYCFVNFVPAQPKVVVVCGCLV